MKDILFIAWNIIKFIFLIILGFLFIILSMIIWILAWPFIKLQKIKNLKT